MPKIGGPEEIIEQIVYSPGLQTTNDLEAATRVITATVEAAGTGNADYSAALTIAAPSDGRLTVTQIGARLSFTIDSFNLATILYCRVYVDVQDADHLLIDTSHDAASNKLAVQHTTSAVKATIFNLLKDGAAHTFYFFFWVNQATSATISVVQLWEGVGAVGNGVGYDSVRLSATGMIVLTGYSVLVGTGLFSAFLTCPAGENPSSSSQYQIWGAAAASARDHGTGGALEHPVMLIKDSAAFGYAATVTTDLIYVREIGFLLRREI